MQRKIERTLFSYAMGLLGLLGLAVAFVAAYYIYTGVRKDIKKQQVVYAKQQARSRLMDDTPLAIALVKARHPDVEAECDRRIKLYSNSVFTSIVREMRLWQVAVAGGPPPRSSALRQRRRARGGSPSGRRVYAVSYECVIIDKILDTVDIEPLKTGRYFLRTDYRVDLNQNKILKKDVSALLETLEQSSWYRKIGTQ